MHWDPPGTLGDLDTSNPLCNWTGASGQTQQLRALRFCPLGDRRERIPSGGRYGQAKETKCGRKGIEKSERLIRPMMVGERAPADPA